MLHKIGSKLKIEASSTDLTDLVVENKPTPEHDIVDKKRSDFLYFRARAISAGDFGPKKGEPNPNGNGDYFPKVELEKAYQTFEGRNLFLNHESDHPVKSVGKVISSELINDPETGEIYVECLSKIDKKLHPEIARKVETGELDTVSMGCSCEESMCSICGSKIFTDEDEKCAHLEPQGLLKNFTAEIDLPQYGIQKGRPAQAFAINKGLTFNELSIVNVPADASAFIKGVIASNIKSKISKQAKLDITETSYLQELLNNLDTPTKKKIKADFCGVYPPSLEEKPMSDTSKSKEIKVDKKAVETRTEQDELNPILKSLNAYDYMRLATMFEKKFKKAEEVTTEVTTEAFADKTADAEKVRQMQEKIKKETDPDKKKKMQEWIDTYKEEVKTEAKHLTKKKPDKDKDGVPDWADKYPGKDDKKEKESKSLLNKILEKAKNSMAGRVFAQTIRRLVDTESTEETKSTLTATFEKKDDLKTSTWTIAKHDKPLIVATLDDIWGEELGEQDSDYVASEQYGKDIIAYFNQMGEKKTADLLGDHSYQKMTVPTPKKVKMPRKQDFHHEHNAKEEKVTEKSTEAIGKTEEEVGKHLEPEKKIQEASKVKKFKKKADVMDTAVPEPDPKEESVEEPKQELPGAELKPDVPAEEVEGSVFDNVEKVIIGDGYEAYKDPETGEICIKDAQGQEVKKIPDAFGKDMAPVIDLLRTILDLPPSEEMKPEDGAPAVEAPAEEAPVEAPVEEPQSEDAGMYASKKEALTKEAEELKKQKEALDQEKRALEKAKAELTASKFGASVNSRIDKCRKIVEAMITREMLTIDEEIYTENVDNGATVIDAREAGLQHSVDRQLETLLGMDETSLDSFAKSVTRVQKQASKKLNTAVHMPFNPDKDIDEVANIFNSMGNLKGHSLQEFE